MTNTEKLKEQIQTSGLSESQLATRLNISQHNLHNKINGSTEFRASEIDKLSALLNLSNDIRETIFFSL